VFIDGFVHQLPDVDPEETGEWLDSLDSVIEVGGRSRARYLLARLMERAREQGVGVPAMVSTSMATRGRVDTSDCRRYAAHPACRTRRSSPSMTGSLRLR